MSGSRVKSGGRDERSMDTVLVAICDLYWHQVHRRHFVKLEGHVRSTIAEKLTKWAHKAVPGARLAPIVERLQRQGLVIATIQIESVTRGKRVESVASVQPTQFGLDRAEAIRPAGSAKR